jgi:vacuolar-type H+-ATPase subunit I/STV1
MLVLVGTLFGAWSSVDRRLSHEEALSEAQSALNVRVERQLEAYRTELKAEMDKLNGKLDRQSELLHQNMAVHQAARKSPG